jgi:phosphoenolpyruvate carboxykinase (ATP)
MVSERYCVELTQRISIADTRKIIDAIHDGSLEKATMAEMPVFKFQIPTEIKGLNSAILNPKETWANKDEYDSYLHKVAEMFQKNFKRFEEGVNQAARDAGPKA